MRLFTHPIFGEIKFQTLPCSGSCGKLQLHLSRPAVTNSLPCPAPLQVGEQIIQVNKLKFSVQHFLLQAPLVALTKSLGEVTSHAEASLAAMQVIV